MLIEPCNINPIDVFQKLCLQPYSFFIDSCGLNRYSYAGAAPFALVKSQDSRAIIIEDAGCNMQNVSITTNDIFSTLTSLLDEYKNRFQIPHSVSRIPFKSGLVGYFGYELKNQLERFAKKPAAPPPKADYTPDCIVGLYNTIFIYDHKTNKGYAIASGLPEKNNSKRRLLAKEQMKRFLNTVKKPSAKPQRTKAARPKTIQSNFTKNGYINAIRQVQNYIASGDIYQANISQRLIVNFHGDPLAFYSKLRMINPAEFGTFLNYGDFQVISNSPERLLKVNHGIAETSPIKGTRPRGISPKEDAVLIQDMKTSVKELAEHIMIVDLERNDLGKICEHGTIRIRPLKKIRTYPTLHHMVSTVRGKIKKDICPIDCVKALFPGGSVTGAPKIKAMEIIEELEPTPRGIYTGAIGYIDFCGNMDLSMAIRTAVLKDNRLYLNVGGGIVADSNPEEEYEETILKANAFFKAMEIG